MNFREKLWLNILKKSNHREGFVLPKPLLFIRAILFPGNFIYWKLCKPQGYDWKDNSWTINGRKYSSEFFEAFKEGDCFKVIEVNDTITVSRIHEQV